MKIMVTGSRGFIGQNIKSHLSRQGHTIVEVDRKHDGFDLAGENHWEVVRKAILSIMMEDCDLVIHCAGCADVRKSHIETTQQFEDNVVSTRTVLEAMVETGVKDIIYLSSAVANCSSIKWFDVNAGGFVVDVTKEEDVNQPQSMYGTMKSMAEELIKGYVHNYDMRALILRLENITGPHYSHGILIDFIKKLQDNPKKLMVLGNGKQTKAYLYVTDLTRIIDCLYEKLKTWPIGKVRIVNVGNIDSITVKDIAHIVCGEMKLKPKIVYGDTDAGFKGDIPIIAMSKSKLLSQCKGPRVTSENGIRKTVRWILNGKVNGKISND